MKTNDKINRKQKTQTNPRIRKKKNFLKGFFLSLTLIMGLSVNACIDSNYDNLLNLLLPEGTLVNFTIYVLANQCHYDSVVGQNFDTSCVWGF